MKTVVFIPSKTSSKRIPYKNIRPFANSSLLEITINFFKQHCPHDIYVSSEDDTVLSIADANDCLRHKRSPSITHANATNFHVLNDWVMSQHVVNTRIILAQPSHPMRYIEDLELISSLPHDRDFVSVIASNSKYIDSLSRTCPPCLTGLYKVDGSYYILHSDSIRENTPFNLYPFLLPYPDRRIDIDYMDQFYLAESLFSMESR